MTSGYPPLVKSQRARVVKIQRAPTVDSHAETLLAENRTTSTELADLTAMLRAYLAAVHP